MQAASIKVPKFHQGKNVVQVLMYAFLRKVQVSKYKFWFISLCLPAGYLLLSPLYSTEGEVFS